MPEERRTIHTYVTPPAHDAIHDFCADNGISVSALIEVLGLGIAGDAETPPIKISEESIKAGRKIDATRRRRGGPRS